MTDNFFRAASVVLGLAVLAPLARAGGTGMPSCVTIHALGPTTVEVPGFPGQRLYIHRAHPRECGAGQLMPDCVPNAYVLTGDHLTVGASCDGWSYVSFSSKHGKTDGWVPSRRIGMASSFENFDPARVNDSIRESAPPKLKRERVPPHTDPACVTARNRLNAPFRPAGAYVNPMPSLINNAATETPSDLPHGIAAQATSAVSVADISVNGHPLKAVSYGTESSNGVVELWDRAFEKRVIVGSEDLEEETYLKHIYQDVVSIEGKAYFVEKSPGEVRIFAFDDTYSGHAMCTIRRLLSENAERVKESPDITVCHAALAGTVEDVSLEEITPYGLTRGSILASGGSDPVWTGTPVQVIARGVVDLANDGKPVPVGLALFTNDERTIIHQEWPIILDAGGAAAPLTPLNADALAHAGENDSARLFRFHGSIYFEHRWRSDSTDHSHEIWKVAKAGLVPACTFTTDPSEHYELIDVPRQ